MSTDSRVRTGYRTRLIAALSVLTACASLVQAHGPERKSARSILRLQGYGAVPPSGTSVVQEMVIVARGVERRFWVTDRRRFDLEPATTTPLIERERLLLQGDFDVLARFAKVRGDQLVTILGEQRPGSSDLFILTLDLCPP